MCRSCPTLDDSRPGKPLLQTVMRNGRRVVDMPCMEQIRAHARAELATLPEALRGLGPVPAYPVLVAEPLRRLAEEVDRRTHR